MQNPIPSFVGLILLATSAVGADKPLEANVHFGSNTNGDVVVWSDGSVWKQVTVEKMVVAKQGEKKAAILGVTNVPPAFKSGSFSNAVAVALRSSKQTIPPVRDARLMTKIPELWRTASFKTRSTADLPAVDAKFEDLCVFVWQPEIEALRLKPEYQGQLLRDGKPLGAQFKVTVTHLAMTNGMVYCLVRKNAPEHLFDEGWYSDIDEVYFFREQVK